MHSAHKPLSGDRSKSAANAFPTGLAVTLLTLLGLMDKHVGCANESGSDSDESSESTSSDDESGESEGEEEGSTSVSQDGEGITPAVLKKSLSAWPVKDLRDCCKRKGLHVNSTTKTPINSKTKKGDLIDTLLAHAAVSRNQPAVPAVPQEQEAAEQELAQPVKSVVTAMQQLINKALLVPGTTDDEAKEQAGRQMDNFSVYLSALEMFQPSDLANAQQAVLKGAQTMTPLPANVDYLRNAQVSAVVSTQLALKGEATVSSYTNKVPKIVQFLRDLRLPITAETEGPPCVGPIVTEYAVKKYLDDMRSQRAAKGKAPLKASTLRTYAAAAVAVQKREHVMGPRWDQAFNSIFPAVASHISSVCAEEAFASLENGAAVADRSLFRPKPQLSAYELRQVFEAQLKSPAAPALGCSKPERLQARFSTRIARAQNLALLGTMHATWFRSSSIINMTWADFSVFHDINHAIGDGGQMYPGAPVAKHLVFMAPLHKGQGRQKLGKQVVQAHTMIAARHWDAVQCPIGALARYAVLSFLPGAMEDGSLRIPLLSQDIETRMEWYSRALWTSLPSGAVGEVKLDYAGHSDAVKHLFLTAGVPLPSGLVTHLLRKQRVGVDQASHDVQASVGGWGRSTPGAFEAYKKFVEWALVREVSGWAANDNVWGLLRGAYGAQAPSSVGNTQFGVDDLTPDKADDLAKGRAELADLVDIALGPKLIAVEKLMKERQLAEDGGRTWNSEVEFCEVKRYFTEVALEDLAAPIIKNGVIGQAFCDAYPDHPLAGWTVLSNPLFMRFKTRMAKLFELEHDGRVTGKSPATLQQTSTIRGLRALETAQETSSRKCMKAVCELQTSVKRLSEQQRAETDALDAQEPEPSPKRPKLRDTTSPMHAIPPATRPDRIMLAGFRSSEQARDLEQAAKSRDPDAITKLYKLWHEAPQRGCSMADMVSFAKKMSMTKNWLGKDADQQRFDRIQKVVDEYGTLFENLGTSNPINAPEVKHTVALLKFQEMKNALKAERSWNGESLLEFGRELLSKKASAPPLQQEPPPPPPLPQQQPPLPQQQQQQQ